MRRSCSVPVIGRNHCRWVLCPSRGRSVRQSGLCSNRTFGRSGPKSFLILCLTLSRGSGLYLTSTRRRRCRSVVTSKENRKIILMIHGEGEMKSKDTKSWIFHILCSWTQRNILVAYLSSYGGETLFRLLVCEWGFSSRSHAIGYIKRKKPYIS